MMRYRSAGAAVAVALAGLLGPAAAHADPMPPALAGNCGPEAADAMTLLPDEQTYAICQDGPGGYRWAAVQTPFDPHDIWLSYGPPIVLHGQGMRNPNVTSGQWTATPADPDTVCRAEQQTVVEAGVLSDPQVSEGSADEELSVQFQPKLFYLTLGGNCLWRKD